MGENRQLKFFYGYIIVVAAFLLMAIMWGSVYVFGVFFEPLLTEFGWTRAMTSGAFALSFVMLGLLGIVSGRMTDRYGPRKVVTVCGLFLGSGYLLISQTSAIWQIYLFYGVIVAIGMSGVFVPLSSTVVRWFIKRRGLMTAVVASGVGAGTVIMPLVANWLNSIYGWRNSYIILGVTVLVLVTSIAQFLRRDPSQTGQSPYGESELGEKVGLLTEGFSLQGALHTRQFWMIAGALICFTLNLGVVMVHIVPYAISLEVSATSAAGILALVGGLSIVGRVFMGMVGDRIGNKPALLIAFVLMSLSFFWLLVSREFWMLSVFAVIFGFGYGSLSALISPLLAEHFGLGSLGAILGFLTFGLESGNGIGPVLVGYLVDVSGSYQTAFLACALVSLLSIILILPLRPIRR